MVQCTFTSYNHFHNILRLFDVLPNFPFNINETMSIITYNYGIYEASRVAKRLRIILA